MRPALLGGALSVCARSATCLMAIAGVISLAGIPALAQGTATGVYVEDSPAAVELLKQARQLRSEDRLTDAAEVLQRVLDEHGRQLIRVDQRKGQADSQDQPRRYISLMSHVSELLQADDALLAAYESTHEPTAQRALAKAWQADLLRREHALRDVIDRFGLTTSGQAARIALASWLIERAQPESATRLLLARPRKSPDAIEADALKLLAIAALMRADSSAFSASRQKLIDMGASADTAALDRLTHTMSPVTAGHQPLAAGPMAVDMDQIAAVMPKALWQVNARPDALGSRVRRIQRPGFRATLRITSRQTAELAMHASADSQRVYINAIDSLQAVDRFSGRRLWTVDWRRQIDPRMGTLLSRIGDRSVPDRRGVLLLEQSAVAVIGRYVAWQGNVDDLTTHTSLVSVQRDSGALLWQRSPRQIDPTFSKAYFHGTPALAAGVLVVGLAREAVTGLRDVYMLGLDPGTGDLLWSRHISSVVARRRGRSAAPARWVNHDAMVYVTDGWSTIANLDARTGKVRWLTQYAVDDPRDKRFGEPADAVDDVGFPALVNAGLVVPMPKAFDTAIVLDPETGDRITLPTHTPIPNDATLLPVGDDLLAVGRVIARLDGSTLARTWSTRLTNDPHSPLVIGRPALTTTHLLLGADQEMLAVDLKSGRLTHRFSLQEPSNLLAGPGQVLAISTRTVEAYAPPSKVKAQLTTLMAKRPDDPLPGLSLAHLGELTQDQTALFQGLEHAARIVSTHKPGTAKHAIGPRTIAMVFDQVASLAQSDLIPAPQRQEVFGYLARVAVTPSQQATYHLLLASHLASAGRIAAAIDAYQAVLISTDLSQQITVDRGMTRQAGLEARHQLRQLIENHGQEAYQRHDAAAQLAYEQLLASAAGSERFVELTRQYPVARIVPEALLAAAMKNIEQGQPNTATGLLRQAIRHVRERPELQRRIVSQLVQVQITQGQPRRAIRWLESLAQSQPNAVLTTPSGELGIDQWIQQLKSIAPVERRLPTIAALPTRATVLQGTMPLMDFADEAGPMHAMRDRLLIQDGDILSLWSVAPLQKRWSVDVGQQPVRLIDADDQHLVLHRSNPQQVVTLDMDTGQAIQMPIDVRGVLDQARGAQDTENPGDEAEQQFVRMLNLAPLRLQNGVLVPTDMDQPTVYHVHASQGLVVLADSQGTVAAVHIESGRMLWTARFSVDRLESMDVEQDTVLLKGVTGQGSDAASQAIWLLDVSTGQPRLPPMEMTGQIVDASLDQGQRLIVTLGDEITGIDADTGTTLWRVRLPDNLTDRVVSVRGQRAYLADQLGAINQIDTTTGQVLQRIFVDPGERGMDLDLQAAGNLAIVVGKLSALAIDESGQLVYRLTLPNSPALTPMALLSQRYALVLGAYPDTAMPIPGWRSRNTTYKLHVIEQATGRRLQDWPTPRIGEIDPARSRTVDGHVLLQDRGQVIVFHAPPE